MSSNLAGRRALVVGGAIALLLSACGGSATAAPGSVAPGSVAPASVAPGSVAPASVAPASVAPAGAGDPIAALSDLASYKMTFALTATNTKAGLAAMGDLKMAGTFMTKPEPAADVTISLGTPGQALEMRVVEIGGKKYIDLGTGTLTEDTGTGQTSLLDSMNPQTILGGFSGYLSQMQTVGDEQKNGVATTHLTASPELLAQAGKSLGSLGLENAKWTWDVWIAKDGGYAVSYVMKGIGAADASMSISVDLTDVNSPSNVVKGP